MASSPRSQLAFHVKRREPEIVVLAKPIARELKKLSYIDDQEGMRSLFGLFWFYNNNDSLSKQGKERLSKSLMVDCNGQGALLSEANADVMPQQLDSVGLVLTCKTNEYKIRAYTWAWIQRFGGLF
ncbi:hypothetical protein FNV43_RR09571 [Rhamnella rubrinervis]|uniref:Uncharacterized protein n=1 Tax=Rhamnella rubrinervis TaxID=2594499 RepID=A0A8K0HAP1_9ROSA|nr:hypothetical protein FNV43_RR09571 [Rhamnella rubrinervis]